MRHFPAWDLFSASNTLVKKIRSHDIVVFPLQQIWPPNFSFLAEIKQKILLPENEAVVISYNVLLLNSLAFYIGLFLLFNIYVHVGPYGLIIRFCACPFDFHLKLEEAQADSC